jgi:hypothetical protein
MIFDRQSRYLTAAFAVAVVLSFAALSSQPAEATPLHRDVSPFCLLPGSSNGPGGHRRSAATMIIRNVCRPRPTCTPTAWRTSISAVVMSERPTGGVPGTERLRERHSPVDNNLLCGKRDHLEKGAP